MALCGCLGLMKHPEFKMSLEAALPSSDSVHRWFSQELEQRGIDSLIYTRYIINLLQKESAEPEGLECEDIWDYRKKPKEKREKKKSGSSQEDERKVAAVKLLLTLSDTDCEIENLVDELCIRLKEVKPEQAFFGPLSVEIGEQEKKPVETDDPAERYYAAFPALPGEGTSPAISPSMEGDNVWRRNTLVNQLAVETTERQDTHSAEAQTQETGTSPGKDAKIKEALPSKKPRSSVEKKLSEFRSPRSGGNRKKNSPPANKKRMKKEIGNSSKATRILSWPQEFEMPKEKSEVFVNQRKDYGKKEECMNIEEWIKNILFVDRKEFGAAQDKLLVTTVSSEREDLTPSPEFQENDQWYTKPLEDIIMTPTSESERLYKRHSFPPLYISLEKAAELSSVFYSNLVEDDDDGQSWSNSVFSEQLPVEDTLIRKPKAIWAFETSGEETWPTSLFPDNDSGKDSAVVSDRGSSSSSIAGEIPAEGEEHPLRTSNSPGFLYRECPHEEPVANLWKADFDVDLREIYVSSDEQADDSDAEQDEEETIFRLDLEDDDEKKPVEEVKSKRDWSLPHDNGRLSGDGDPYLREQDPDHLNCSFLPSFRSSETREDDQSHALLFTLDDSNQPQPSLFSDNSSDAVPINHFFINGDDVREKVPSLSSNRSHSSQDEWKEAFFPSDLFNSFNSGDGYHEDPTSVPLQPLLDREYLSRWNLDEQDSGLKPSPSLFFHLSPSSSVEPGWHSTVFLDRFNSHHPLDFNTHYCFSANFSSDVASCISWGSQIWTRSVWDAKLTLNENHNWSSCLYPDTHPVVGTENQYASPDLEHNLWQLWDVNSHRKQQYTESGWSIWNSIVALPAELDESTHPASTNYSSTSQSPEGDEVFDNCAENQNSNCFIFQELEAMLDGSQPRSRLKYDRSVSEGDLCNAWNGVWSRKTPEEYMTRSFELIPSENSAFQEVIPRVLHHVRSAPNIKYTQVERKRKKDVDTVFPEHLYFSSQTHFRPIQTPLGTPEEETIFSPPDLFGGYSKNGTPYQKYRDPEAEDEHHQSRFLPRFKVQKDLDKYIQTSLEEENDTSEHGCVSERPQVEEIITLETAVLPDNLLQENDWDKPRNEVDLGDGQKQHHFRTVFEGPVSEWGNKGQDFKDGDKKQASVVTERIRSIWNSQPNRFADVEDCQMYHSIWSVGYEPGSSDSNDIDPQRVQTIYALSNPMKMPVLEDDLGNLKDDTVCEKEDRDPYFFHAVSGGEAEDVQPFSAGSDHTQNHDFGGLVPIPNEAVYSTDLERKWHNEPQLTPEYLGKFSRFKSIRAQNKKPCSFYLEGKCRRSDCKFSHDLSSITCRFWQEGNCFKGSHCPFLHGYPSDSETASSAETQESFFELKKIDFPELGQAEPKAGSSETSQHGGQLQQDQPKKDCSKRSRRCRFGSKQKTFISTKVIDAQ